MLESAASCLTDGLSSCSGLIYRYATLKYISKHCVKPGFSASSWWRWGGEEHEWCQSVTWGKFSSAAMDWSQHGCYCEWTFPLMLHVYLSHIAQATGLAQGCYCCSRFFSFSFGKEEVVFLLKGSSVRFFPLLTPPVIHPNPSVLCFLSGTQVPEIINAMI